MPREVAVTLKVDHAQALRNIQAVDAAAANMQKNLGKAIAVTQSSKASEQALSRLGQSIGQVSKAQLDNINAMRRWVQTQDTLRGGVVKANGAVSNAAGSFQKYKVAVNESGNTTRNFTLSVNTATGEVYQLDTGVRSVSNSLQTMTMRAKNFIAQTVGFNGLAQSMRYAFTEMKKMSDEMITYQKVTGASGSQLAQVRASAYSSAKAYGKTPSDYLSSVSEFARAGYKETSAAMADLATKTQLVGDMSAEMASSFLLATDAGYKLQGNVEKLNKVLDSANVIDNRYATSIEKIAEGMTLTASLANQVNMPIEQLMAGLGTMTAVTQRSGSEMGRALRSVMLTIMKDTTAEVEEGVTVTQEQIESLNDALNRYASDAVRAANATGKLLNPMEALGALAKAYQDGLLNDQSLTEILSGIGGERYSNALISLVTNWDEVYTKMLDDIATAAGSADAEVTAMTSGWTAKFNILKTTWTEVVNDTISEDLIKRTLDFGTGILESAGNLENLTLVAGGASIALKNLNNALKAGGFTSLTKWGTGLGLGVAAVGMIKSAYDNYYSELQESAEKAAAKAVSVADEVKTTTLSAVEALKELRALDEDGNGFTDNDKLEEAKTLHEEIVKLIGDEAEGYEKVNSNIQAMTASLAEQMILKNNEALADINVTKLQVMNNFAKQNIKNGLVSDAYSMYVHGQGLDYSTKKDAEFLKAIDEYTKDNTYVKDLQRTYGNKTSLSLYYPVIENVEDAKKVYEEFIDLQRWMASDLMPGSDTTWGGEYTKFNNKLGSFITSFEKILQPYLDVRASENQVTAANLLLGNGIWGESFADNASFDKRIDQLIEEIGAEEDLAKAIREQAESYRDLTVAKKESEGATDDTKSGFDSITASIEKATTAKEAFDKAMSTTMADGLLGYQEAFETLKKEIDEGRINSTAAHAAYRMLLGDEAYAATGGNAQMLQSMYAEAAENYKTLFASYKNEHGDVVQGGGVLKIAEQSGLNVRDANGNYRYDFTAADLQKMSNYSKLSTELLMSALGALEQYDQGGVNKALIDGESSPEVQATEANTTATEANTTAVEALAKAIGGDGKDPSFQYVSDDSMLGNFASNVDVPPVEVPVEADTEPAETDIDKLNGKTVTVYGKLKLTSIAGSGSANNPVLLETNTNFIHGYADGTDGHPGGLALVNDGTGSNAGGELIVQNGRAFIAGGGSPALVNLQRGARVFSASETRKILSGGVRSYAQGSHLHSTGSGAWGNGYVASGSSGLIGGSSESLASGSTDFGGLYEDDSNSNDQNSNSSGTTYKKFSDLSELMEYIIERLGKALEEQVEAIDGQIQALREAREASDSQKELEERQEAVAEAQKDLQDAMNERTVRVLNDDGTWSWQSDSRNVEKAKETLKDAEDALKEYQDDLAFEAQVNALEAEKERLQKEYAGISDAWSEIQSAVSTPKGNLSSVLASILKGGSATDKTGAKAVQELLIGSLLTGGSYSGNYQEALDALSAAAKGSPVMPTESGLNLAQLIASSGTGASDALLAAALAGGSGVLGASGSAGSSSVTQIGDSYYFNGVQIGSDMWNRPLSEIIRQLTVYTNT